MTESKPSVSEAEALLEAQGFHVTPPEGEAPKAPAAHRPGIAVFVTHPGFHKE